MKYDKPKVKEVYPVGNSGLMPVPEHLDMEKLLSRSEFFIHNPFDSGLQIKTVPAAKVTYETLASGFILDSPNHIDRFSRGHESLERHQLLSKTGETFWPVAVAMFRRLLSVPKRDMGPRVDIKPDMGLIVSPPNRKIDGPKNTRKPGPPKPGGR